MEKLTNQEKEVLKLLTFGLYNREIADKLCISNHTVKTHLESIYRKLDVHNKLQAVVKVFRGNIDLTL